MGEGNERGLIWTPALSKQDYITQVQRILHHIHEGDIYQANFAQTFTAPFTGDSYGFWRHLLRQNPAPFFAYIQRPEVQILSTSPELLLRQRGTHVESRPIKGTRPRGCTTEEDAAMCSELLASEKEGAELNMIVDLVRNDLHRSCVTGSVAVRQHRVIESYTNVFHQISVITGKLALPQTNIAALEALFPGGSITGCPKIRAMEIIADTEQRPRGIYTGSIGYASLHGTQDWNIAIRTAIVQNETMSLSVGGGIVADSNPKQEYKETLHKAATFFATPTDTR
jgi:para-aminobenzoate synthetase component 1